MLNLALAKSPLFEQDLMPLHHFTREFCSHLWQQPNPKAADIVEQDVLFFTKLVLLLAVRDSKMSTQ